MDFRAPSAKEVYRYALRLDRPNRNLTDGFGFSLIMVNDGSPTCIEFLQKYFVKLCHITADRVRFIFFSDLGQEELQRNITYNISPLEFILRMPLIRRNRHDN
jgi:hypothetical protein